MRKFPVIGGALAIVLGLSAVGLNAIAAAQAPSGAPQRMLAAVNAARAAEGLTPLSANARLDAAACRQAKDLGGRALHDVESLSHRGGDGSTLGDRLRDAGYAFRAAAENLAAGVSDPDETVRLWLASDGHRRNILTPDFREAGIAEVGPRLSPGGNRTGPMAVWVLVLARPAQTAASAPGEVKSPNDCRG